MLSESSQAVLVPNPNQIVSLSHPNQFKCLYLIKHNQSLPGRQLGTSVWWNIQFPQPLPRLRELDVPSDWVAFHQDPWHQNWSGVRQDPRHQSCGAGQAWLWGSGQRQSQAPGQRWRRAVGQQQRQVAGHWKGQCQREAQFRLGWRLKLGLTAGCPGLRVGRL